MGLLLSCDKCTPTGTETVLTFSDSLVERLTVGEGKKFKKFVEKNHFYSHSKLNKGELDTYDQYEEELLEQNYMDRIKCVDHSHSIAYGLTTDSFNSLVKHLERKFTEDHEASEMFTRQEVTSKFSKIALFLTKFADHKLPKSPPRVPPKLLPCHERIHFQTGRKTPKKSQEVL